MSPSSNTDERLPHQSLRDQEARDTIVRDLDHNIMVLAGAGAGKTHALIERMVASIREGVCEVDRMAAITFTRKAAGEMRGRFSVRLRREARSAGSEEEVARIRSALTDIDQCFIGTIHSFCGRLLRERPIEAGLAPDFTEIDDRDESSLRREVWDRFVQERYVDEDPRLGELEEHGLTPDDLYTFFGQRCEYADLRLKETSTPRPDLTPYADAVLAFVEDVFPCIPDDPEKRDALMLAVRQARHFRANHGIEAGRDEARLLRIFEGSNRVTLKHWCDSDRAKEIRDDLYPRLRSDVVEPALRRWREHAYGLVTGLVEEASTYYERVRHREGLVTFQDLLLRAAELLRSSPRARGYFQRRYRTILVDEFQDTDPIQARLLLYLAGTDLTETDWRCLTPRPGSLFLVGDDKQSIYRFRRADVEIFRFVADHIEETGGRVVHLKSSFRSLGRLCAWINGAFPSIFSADTDRYQAPFEPLHEVRPAGVDRYGVRKIVTDKIPRNPSASIAAVDAERIASFIAAAMQGHTELNHGDEPGAVLGETASAGDFLILTRTTGRLAVYARALEAYDIPFDIVGGGRLGDSAEVEAFVTLLEAIRVPDNPVPFLSYLRGPFVGMSDADLYAYRRAGGRWALNESVPDELPGALRDRFLEAIEHLERGRDLLEDLPPGAALERILDRTGFLALSATHPDGSASSRAGNLVRLLSLARRQAARGWHWGRIVEDLREMVEQRDYKVEQMTLETGRDDVVRVMNVHQAKGLQAPVVFLADPYDTSYDKEPLRHVSRSGDASYVSMPVTRPKGEYHHEIVAQPAGWAADKEEEMRYGAAEETRLLYVAATRARNMLIVSQYAGKADAGSWSPLYRYLEDVPELPSVAPQEGMTQAAAEGQYDRLRREGISRLDASRQPTYAVQTVTGRRAEEEVEHSAREGRGRDYGIVVHQLFEEAVRGVLPDDLAAYIDVLIRENGLAQAMARDAYQALDRLLSSELWKRIVRASEVYTEVPIGMSAAEDGGAAEDEVVAEDGGIIEDGGVVRGVIDLVFRDEQGWHIVDYKTDAVETEAEARERRRTYASQLAAYRTYWNRATDLPVVTADIWFVHGPDRFRS